MERQAGLSTEIEITPAMVSAGRERYLDLAGVVDSTFVVVEVYQAMRAASPQVAHLAD